jgi:polyisoprenoid-binding protein YceI
MKSRKGIVIALAAIGLTAAAAASAALSSPSEARVGFVAGGSSGIRVEGTTTELAVADDNGALVLTVPLGKLTTGIALRDHHMRDKYLEVPKYPNAVLTIARGAVKVPAKGEHVEADVPGSLQLHGQTRPVSVHYEATGDAGAVAAKGKFHVNMNDFGISIPSYLGVTVKPDVDVSATFRVAGP